MAPEDGSLCDPKHVGVKSILDRILMNFNKYWNMHHLVTINTNKHRSYSLFSSAISGYFDVNLFGPSACEEALFWFFVFQGIVWTDSVLGVLAVQ